MLEALNWQSSLDGWIIATAAICAANCGLLGSFLMVRGLSMLGDSISHTILPGLAAAFILSGSRDSLWMFMGAATVGILTAILTEFLGQVGTVDKGASLGIIFTTLFALGLVLIVRFADTVDLDPGCVLYGALELIPLDTVELMELKIPRAFLILSTIFIFNLTVVMLLFKEFQLAAFDQSFSKKSGYNPLVLHYLLVGLVALTAVASFQAVGNILVVAFFSVPACIAALCSQQLRHVCWISMLVGVIGAVLGHLGALSFRLVTGLPTPSSAGMVAVVLGGILGGVLLLTRVSRKASL